LKDLETIIFEALDRKAKQLGATSKEKEEYAAIHADYKGKSEANQKVREGKKARWGTCTPWFDPVYKSRAPSTERVYQALAMQDVVAHEAKYQVSTVVL
jgi:hypothetical protein